MFAMKTLVLNIILCLAEFQRNVLSVVSVANVAVNKAVLEETIFFFKSFGPPIKSCRLQLKIFLEMLAAN